MIVKHRPQVINESGWLTDAQLRLLDRKLESGEGIVMKDTDGEVMLQVWRRTDERMDRFYWQINPSCRGWGRVFHTVSMLFDVTSDWSFAKAEADDPKAAWYELDTKRLGYLRTDDGKWLHPMQRDLDNGYGWVVGIYEEVVG